MEIEAPPRFRPALDALAGLARSERYRAGLVFGSLARGEAGDDSDVDAQVVVDQDVPCRRINHPRVGGVKLDITFKSLTQLRAQTEQEIARGERVPIVAESLILFDKDGALTRLQAEARRVERPPVDPSEHDSLQFSLYHVDDKVGRSLTADPPAALLVMAEGLTELLHIHYRLHRRWSLSSKRRLADLRGWDPELARLVEPFVAAGEVAAKHRLWREVLAHVARPLGGLKPIEETSCGCPACRADLAALLGAGG